MLRYEEICFLTNKKHIIQIILKHITINPNPHLMYIELNKNGQMWKPYDNNLPLGRIGQISLIQSTLHTGNRVCDLTKKI